MIGKAVGQDSILDSFEARSQVHCPASGMGPFGKAHPDVNECALLCLMYDDCSHFEWNHPTSEINPCYIKTGCGFASHSTADTYTRANSNNWLIVPDISEMPG